jgi:predicted TIM-barrel fold metal-dependent hydrolase
MPLAFFDCNCQVGRFGTPAPGLALTPEALEAELRHFGIARVLAHHALAREYAPAEGNRALLQDRRPWLEPCWVVMPHHTGEVPPPARLLREMAAADVRAVRLFPRDHSWRLGEWSAGELLAALEKKRIVTLLDQEQTDWDEVDALCEAHPDLPLILLRPNYRTARFLYPLFERHTNLRIEFSLYHVHRGLEEICQHYGAERLVFGTGLPAFSPGGPIALTTYADVPEADRRAMAGGTLALLLGRQTP